MTKNSIKYASIIVFGYNAVLGIIFAVFCSQDEQFDYKTFRTCLSMFNGVGAVFVFAWLVKIMFVQRESLKIFKAKGICPEYVDALRKQFVKNKLSNIQLVNYANALCFLERYDEAEQVLNRAPGESLQGPLSKPWYYKTYIWLYLCTGRYRQALDIFDASRGQLEKFFCGEGGNACAFYDDAALCSAIRRDFQTAEGFRIKAAEAAAAHPDRAHSPYMIMAELFILDGNEFEAQRAIEAARQAAINCQKYKYPWQRDNVLHSLDISFALARKIRHDVFESQMQ